MSSERRSSSSLIPTIPPSEPALVKGCNCTSEQEGWSGKKWWKMCRREKKTVSAAAAGHYVGATVSGTTAYMSELGCKFGVVT